jgi:aryl-alcohol dehydrogenase-like predicted oxidoreductase
MDDRGIAVLGVLDELAAAHDTTMSAVALAWLLAQPTVLAPIASARTTDQLAQLLPMADLTLTADELERLTSASA